MVAKFKYRKEMDKESHQHLYVIMEFAKARVHTNDKLWTINKHDGKIPRTDATRQHEKNTERQKHHGEFVRDTDAANITRPTPYANKYILLFSNDITDRNVAIYS
jgi:hypothetical protein